MSERVIVIGKAKAKVIAQHTRSWMEAKERLELVTAAILADETGVMEVINISVDAGTVTVEEE